MIAIDQSRKRGTSTGWNVVERENEGHSQSQLYHEVSPASLAFSHQRYDSFPIFIDEMRMRTVVSSSIYSSPWAEVNLDNPALLISVLLMRWSVWIVLK